MQEHYIENEEFRTNMRMISALAFVSLADIGTSFEALSQYCTEDEEQPILDYFESNYIGEQRRDRR